MPTHTLKEEIIAPVPVEQLEAELTPERMLRRTNKGGNEIYVVDGHTCPAVMQAAARARALT